MYRVQFLFWGLIFATGALADNSSTNSNSEPRDPFRKGGGEFGVNLGAGFGTQILGSESEHDLALISVQRGWIFSNAMAHDSFVEGHFEGLGEIFGGAQFYPEARYIVGALPLIRYNFTHYRPFVPFGDFGVGVALTDISGPDLGGTFQFNEQLGCGLHYFFAEKTSLTFQYRFVHVSNAGIKLPNNGMNTSIFSLGVAWFF